MSLFVIFIFAIVLYVLLHPEYLFGIVTPVLSEFLLSKYALMISADVTIFSSLFMFWSSTICPYPFSWRGRRGHMVVTTICAIRAYHHYSCKVVKLNPTPWRAVEHYMIKLVNDLWQIVCFLLVIWFLPPIKLTDKILNWNIIKGGVKHYNFIFIFILAIILLMFSSIISLYWTKDDIATVCRAYLF
jgi:hypothetical protein